MSIQFILELPLSSTRGLALHRARDGDDEHAQQLEHDRAHRPSEGDGDQQMAMVAVLVEGEGPRAWRANARAHGQVVEPRFGRGVQDGVWVVR